ncbi:caspase domain-containing protein [Armillaria borealis]|uniref:Caspase domain-containing protein n=1 Tax=Armillaria borealis TaxID=47425 RepID=A0AA39J000_9AGAR|nr:caspase domain-containing protein [Armillaria borealis]
MQADTLEPPSPSLSRTSEVPVPSSPFRPKNLHPFKVQEFGYSLDHYHGNMPIDDLENITQRIAVLEDFEKATGKEYGMPEESPDSDFAIRERAKKEAIDALAKSEDGKEEKVQTAETLDILFRLRRLAMTLQLPRSPGSSPSLSANQQNLACSKLVRSPEGSRFWAVIIGIDAYPFSPLRGCVSDARTMTQYLINDLNVPGSQIDLLLASRDVPGCQDFPDVNSVKFPSRKNIVQILLNLRANPLIKPGDNIIVYFSGHGSSYSCEEYFPRETCGHIGAIEAICPVDRNERDKDGRIISDISDRELNAILTLVRRKGANITVIADCCHAASLTRGPSYAIGTARVLPALVSAVDDKISSLESMLREGDEGLRKHSSNVPSVLAPDWSANMSSHVLLAACKDFQYAREVQNSDGTHGIFTEALVRALKSEASKSCTYEGLCNALQIPREFKYLQTPCAAGDHINTYLWTDRPFPR